MSHHPDNEGSGAHLASGDDLLVDRLARAEAEIHGLRQALALHTERQLHTLRDMPARTSAKARSRQNLIVKEMVEDCRRFSAVPEIDRGGRQSCPLLTFRLRGLTTPPDRQTA